MSNTLRKVTLGDMTSFKDCLSTFITWYQMNCEKLREIAEVWLESEDETLVSILSRGLTSLEQQTDIVKEADKNESA